MLSSQDLSSFLLLLLQIWLANFLLKIVYRVSPLHPLYHIPGPTLAKSTYLYEIYFDLIKGGLYTEEIERLHSVYGPLVRINPDGLHSNDPYFVDEVYASGSRKRDKPFLHVKFLVGALRSSAFGTKNHTLHRRRREPLNKFFSKASVSKSERDIHGLAQQLGDKILATAANNREIFEFQDAVCCYTSDVIGLHAFGKPLGFLRQAGFVPNLKRASWPMFTTYYVCRWLEPARWCLENFGAYVSRFMPELATYNSLYDVEIPTRISQIKAEHDAGLVCKRETAFDALLDSNLPEHEKSEERLQGEAGVFMIAGTDTTSWTLTVATFFLLRDPALLARLTAELLTVVTDPRNLPSWSDLEQLPLLGAVLNEALRLSYGVAGRSSRIATHEDLVYRGCWTPPDAKEVVGVAHVVPRGFSVGMSTLLLHHNEKVFPDSEKFIPERWLDENGRRKKELERFLFSFSKGTRSCLGMNLAYCEICLALAVLVVRVYPHMQLYDTTIDDVKLYRDLFVPVIKDGRKGVRVFMTE